MARSKKTAAKTKAKKPTAKKTPPKAGAKSAQPAKESAELDESDMVEDPPNDKAKDKTPKGKKAKEPAESSDESDMVIEVPPNAEATKDKTPRKEPPANTQPKRKRKRTSSSDEEAEAPPKKKGRAAGTPKAKETPKKSRTKKDESLEEACETDCPGPEWTLDMDNPIEEKAFLWDVIHGDEELTEAVWRKKTFALNITKGLQSVPDDRPTTREDYLINVRHHHLKLHADTRELLDRKLTQDQFKNYNTFRGLPQKLKEKLINSLMENYPNLPHPDEETDTEKDFYISLFASVYKSKKDQEVRTQTRSKPKKEARQAIRPYPKGAPSTKN